MEKIRLKLRFVAFNTGKCDKEEFRINRQFDSNLTLWDIISDIYKDYYVRRGLNREDEHINAFVYNRNLFERVYGFSGLIPEPASLEITDIPLIKLENQFGFSKIQHTIWLDSGIGGDVGYCRGIHFFFRTSEKYNHYTPHIHCRYGKEETRINLYTLTFMDEKFKNPRNNKIAIDAIKQNKRQLINYWNKVVVNGESLKFKMFIKI